VISGAATLVLGPRIVCRQRRPATMRAVVEFNGTDDLLGSWCGTKTNYTFTRTQLTVAPLRGQSLTHGSVLTIGEVVGRPDQIDVYWAPLGDPNNFTRFSFSSDKRSLIQARETTGDNGPRLTFNQC
jgi:hypothetical protein